MALYEDLVQKVAIHLSPCPEMIILDAIKQTVINFCTQTQGWVFDAPTIAPEDGVLTYQLDTPANTAIIKIWSLEGRTGQYQEDQNYYIGYPNLLNFHVTPSAFEIKPVLSLIPTLTSTEFPDYLMNYFYEYLVSGAVAMLQLMPFREWSQPNAAEYHSSKYQVGIHEALKMRDNGLNKAKTRNRVRAQYI